MQLDLNNQLIDRLSESYNYDVSNYINKIRRDFLSYFGLKIKNIYESNKIKVFNQI